MQCINDTINQLINDAIKKGTHDTLDDIHRNGIRLEEFDEDVGMDDEQLTRTLVFAENYTTDKQQGAYLRDLIKIQMNDAVKNIRDELEVNVTDTSNRQHDKHDDDSDDDDIEDEDDGRIEEIDMTGTYEIMWGDS